MAEMFEEMGDLGGSDAAQGEWRETVFGEKLSVGGFIAVLRSATGEFGEEEKFVGVERMGRMIVEVAVENGGEFSDANFIARFLAGFAGRGDRGRLANIRPTAGEGPAAILQFTDE